MWVALHITGAIKMGWEDDISDIYDIKSLCTMVRRALIRQYVGRVSLNTLQGLDRLISILLHEYLLLCF